MREGAAEEGEDGGDKAAYLSGAAQAAGPVLLCSDSARLMWM